MSVIITELKKEQRLLLELLKKVRKLGIGSEEGQKSFMFSEGHIIRHLDRVNTNVYDVLRKEGEIDPHIKQMLRMYGSDVEILSKDVKMFFGKYKTGDKTMEFAREFGQVTIRLTQRIQREQQLIFKKFEALQESL